MTSARSSRVPRRSSPAIDAAPISVEQGGSQYRVEPLHRYALDGLVVSYRHHDGDRMIHRLWNDHLNVADLCVVWGENARNGDLDLFEFWNGQFTCFFRTRDDGAWRRFRLDQMSNNHLITADPLLRDAIDDVQVGDQIHLEGYLASYANGDGFARGTSTTRTDTGNGACETIYVTRFEVRSSMDSLWRKLESVSWGALLLSAFLWLVGVGRGVI